MNKPFWEKIKKELQNGKFETEINVINKVFKFILQTSSLFTLLSFLIMLKEYNFTFENENSTPFDGILGIIVFLAFYLIIFGVLPIFCILILVHILNRKFEIEIIKIKLHYKFLAINIVLVSLTILVAILYHEVQIQC